MSEEQQRSAAGVWHMWQRSRATLDAHFTAALAPLASLLDTSELPVGTIRAFARGIMGAQVESEVPEGTSAQYHCSAGGSSLWEPWTGPLARRLLGVDGRLSWRVQAASRALSEVHARDAREFVEELRAVCIPGVMFTPEQCARHSALSLRHGVLVDWFWLCKVAAEEVRRSEMLADVEARFGAI